MSEATGASGASSPPAVGPAPTERGWGKFLLALAAFFLTPALFPHLRVLLPFEQTIQLYVPALAACTMVGWWAGGRVLSAVAWGTLAMFVAMQAPALPGSFTTLARGWCLLVAGAFGLVCLFGTGRPFFTRALLALTLVAGVVLVMGVLGPVAADEAQTIVSGELSRRAADSMVRVRQFVQMQGPSWERLVQRIPQMAEFVPQLERQLELTARAGTELFPALLGLETLCALALAWATYHRLSRARLGAPLAPLKEFRFNDQLVWGLIVGLAIVFLPAFEDSLRPIGRNLLLFFGALYAVRGLGVLSWFLAPGALPAAAVVGFLMLMAPVLNVFAVLGFFLLFVAAFGLGLGDTWADWRRRARPTS
jgi:hypothetical protein